MESEIKLTKLAKCAGCGAKVGAGTLTKLLSGIETISDERLLVGFDKSDDAAVYRLSDEQALVQTLDFFPPIVDDPFLFGQIAATNAISDIYAMGGEPKLALNIMTVTNQMTSDMIHEVLRGGYEKAYEAGVIICGGHTIEDEEPKYGLSVTGFVHPDKLWKNSGAKEGDLLVLTKPLGIGILTTAAKADMVDREVMDKVYKQMATLNRKARDILSKYEVHSCTDVTGFALLGHGLEMAQGSGATIHLQVDRIPYLEPAPEMASMGFVPAGAYRNRDFAQEHVELQVPVSRQMQDVLYDPQTSGGLLAAVSADNREALEEELSRELPMARIIGYVGPKENKEIVLE